MIENIITINNVSLSYNGHDILKDVTFNIKKGNFLGLIGPNGGGKTTLLKIILGLIKPTKGNVIVADDANIGYVPQFSNFDLDFPIDVWDVILSARIKGKKPWSRMNENDRKVASGVLKKFGIYDIRKRQIGELSGGQKQRVLIARALATEPDILLLDEPTASVDTVSGEKIYDTLKELNAKGMTIILVSHDVGVLSKYVRDVACVNVWLFGHGDKKLTGEMMDKAYACPIDIIAHGHPHRVFEKDRKEAGNA
ncbi:MAG: ABC transporter ATP-binding protein [Candidatus Micrarchaeota archaeon]|nr:ABC transporter ATP-binding protein [Candidatus Micrarchaeota archaeon]